jgi:hypothetical protein
MEGREMYIWSRTVYELGNDDNNANRTIVCWSSEMGRIQERQQITDDRRKEKDERRKAEEGRGWEVCRYYYEQRECRGRGKRNKKRKGWVVVLLVIYPSGQMAAQRGTWERGQAQCRHPLLRWCTCIWQARCRKSAARVQQECSKSAARVQQECSKTGGYAGTGGDKPESRDKRRPDQGQPEWAGEQAMCQMGRV